MDLRPELLPPPVSRQRLEELCHEIERIADLVAAHLVQADAEVAAFNALTGHDYSPFDFVDYSCSRSLEAFAKEAARPARPHVPDVTRDELVEIVQQLLAASPETDRFLRLLEANVPHPRISDLIFHPPTELHDASPAQIVEEAFTHRPIAL
ncbi:hypothetical protein [Streptomyces sp. NPDC089919]|uniref:hypothetical protein n=1 Tax=Streptomyces sp. NPDC089919 TaxID=3155188 RepID=UPI0034390AA5